MSSITHAAHLHHQSFLVKDLESEAATLTNIMGITFNVFKIAPEICLVNGDFKPYSFKVAIASIGTSNLELISPFAGESILDQHLASRGEGYHHSGISFYDHSAFVSAKSDLIAKGFKPIQYGKTESAFEFGYFQLPIAGIIVELLYIEKMPEPDSTIVKRNL